VLAVDVALTRLLESYGLRPDAVMGHSLGEYGALVAAGALPFADALEAVSARGREMTRVSVGDTGRMAAVMAPIEQIESVLAASLATWWWPTTTASSRLSSAAPASPWSWPSRPSARPA